MIPTAPRNAKVLVSDHVVVSNNTQYHGAFPALQAGREGSDTILKGPLEDQAALHGILVQIERLGIELLEVRRLPALS